MAALTRFSSSSNTRIWEHLNTIVNEVEAALQDVPRVAAGKTSITTTGSTSKSVTINFPPGQFTGPPSVTAMLSGATGHEQKWTVKSASVSMGSAILQVSAIPSSGASAATLPIHWVAVQG